MQFVAILGLLSKIATSHTIKSPRPLHCVLLLNKTLFCRDLLHCKPANLGHYVQCITVSYFVHSLNQIIMVKWRNSGKINHDIDNESETDDGTMIMTITKTMPA